MLGKCVLSVWNPSSHHHSGSSHTFYSMCVVIFSFLGVKKSRHRRVTVKSPSGLLLSAGARIWACAFNLSFSLLTYKRFLCIWKDTEWLRPFKTIILIVCDHSQVIWVSNVLCMVKEKLIVLCKFPTLSFCCITKYPQIKWLHEKLFMLFSSSVGPGASKWFFWCPVCLLILLVVTFWPAEADWSRLAFAGWDAPVPCALSSPSSLTTPGAA